MAGEVKIKIEVAGAEQAQSQIKKTSDAIDSGGTGGGSLTGSMFKGAFAAQALMKGIELAVDVMSRAINVAVDYGKKIFEGAAYLQEYNFQLSALFKTKKEADAFADAIDNIAWVIPRIGEEAVRAYGKELLVAGYSGESTIKILRELGDITAVVGSEKMPLFIGVLEKVKQSGKLTSRQLIDLAKSGLDLSEAFGINAKTLNEFDPKEFIISAADMEKALQKVTTGTGQFANKNEEYFDTINGAMQSMNGVIDETSDHFATALTPAITKIIQTVRQLYMDVSGKLIIAFDKLAANKDVQLFFSNLWKVVEGVGNFIANVLVGAFEFLMRVFEKISPSLNRIFTAFTNIFNTISSIVTGDQINQLGTDLENTFTNALIIVLELIAKGLEKVFIWLQSKEGQTAIQNVATFIGDLFDVFSAFCTFVNGNDAKAMRDALTTYFTVITIPLQILVWTLRTAISLIDILAQKQKKKAPIATGWSGSGEWAGGTSGSGGGGGGGGWYHEGGFIPQVAGGNVPIIAQSGEFVIPRKIVEEIRRGDTYNNDNTKSNIININVQGGMDRRQATDTGFLFSNLLSRI